MNITLQFFSASFLTAKIPIGKRYNPFHQMLSAQQEDDLQVQLKMHDGGRYITGQTSCYVDVAKRSSQYENCDRFYLPSSNLHSCSQYVITHRLLAIFKIFQQHIQVYIHDLVIEYNKVSSLVLPFSYDQIWSIGLIYAQDAPYVYTIASAKRSRPFMTVHRIDMCNQMQVDTNSNSYCELMPSGRHWWEIRRLCAHAAEDASKYPLSLFIAAQNPDKQYEGDMTHVRVMRFAIAEGQIEAHWWNVDKQLLLNAIDSSLWTEVQNASHRREASFIELKERNLSADESHSSSHSSRKSRINQQSVKMVSHWPYIAVYSKFDFYIILGKQHGSEQSIVIYHHSRISAVQMLSSYLLVGDEQNELWAYSILQVYNGNFPQAQKITALPKHGELSSISSCSDQIAVVFGQEIWMVISAYSGLLYNFDDANLHDSIRHQSQQLFISRQSDEFSWMSSLQQPQFSGPILSSQISIRDLLPISPISTVVQILLNAVFGSSPPGTGNIVMKCLLESVVSRFCQEVREIKLQVIGTPRDVDTNIYYWTMASDYLSKRNLLQRALEKGDTSGFHFLNHLLLPALNQLPTQEHPYRYVYKIEDVFQQMINGTVQSWEGKVRSICDRIEKKIMLSNSPKAIADYDRGQSPLSFDPQLEVPIPSQEENIPTPVLQFLAQIHNKYIQIPTVNLNAYLSELSVNLTSYLFSHQPIQWLRYGNNAYSLNESETRATFCKLVEILYGLYLLYCQDCTDNYQIPFEKEEKWGSCEMNDFYRIFVTIRKLADLISDMPNESGHCNLIELVASLHFDHKQDFFNEINVLVEVHKYSLPDREQAAICRTDLNAIQAVLLNNQYRHPKKKQREIVNQFQEYSQNIEKKTQKFTPQPQQKKKARLPGKKTGKLWRRLRENLQMS